MSPGEQNPCKSDIGLAVVDCQLRIVVARPTSSALQQAWDYHPRHDGTQAEYLDGRPGEKIPAARRALPTPCGMMHQGVPSQRLSQVLGNKHADRLTLPRVVHMYGFGNNGRAMTIYAGNPTGSVIKIITRGHLLSLKCSYVGISSVADCL